MKSLIFTLGLLLAMTGWGPAATADRQSGSEPQAQARAERELSFSNAGATLRGTLVWPAGVADPAVLVVTHGASSPTRDLPLYAHLSEILPRLGMAVFVYDRRGSGESEGSLADSDYVMLADDAIAAGRAVAGQPGFARSRIGYWGLSQGGWLAMLAATRDPDAAFAISVSAPFVTPDAQMMHATKNILKINGYGQDEIDLALAARRASDGFLRGEVDRETAQARLDAAAGRPWFGQIYMSPRLGDPATSRWLREMNHDPVTVLEGLTAPTLVVYGDADPWIPVEGSLEALKRARRRPDDLAVVVLEGVDHSMMTSAPPSQQIDPAHFPRNRPEADSYFAILGAWLAEHDLTKVGRGGGSPQ